MSDNLHTITVRLPDGLQSWEIEELITEAAQKLVGPDNKVVNLKNRGGVIVDPDTRDTSWTYEYQVIHPNAGGKSGTYI
ncbi:hypothetical protein [Mycobacterium sp. E2733]|uniref:hypothetical protein n=1 Tax=Mycobacterium sp. E2733 TaxID=1834138 RepID=UPI0012EAED96|nr:hypothetical protein [Mycobacterium sp. E2733]